MPETTLKPVKRHMICRIPSSPHVDDEVTGHIDPLFCMDTKKGADEWIKNLHLTAPDEGYIYFVLPVFRVEKVEVKEATE